MSRLLHRDLRDALRAIGRRPLAAATLVVTLALGMGATLALASLVDAVLLAPFPTPDPERLLYVVSTRTGQGGHYGVAYHNYMGWRQADAFAAMTAFKGRMATLNEAGSGERIAITTVAPSYFATLEVEPTLGRRFTAEDLRARQQLAILSHGLWQRRFGGAEDVLGAQLDLDGELHTVIGVMPAGRETHFLGYRDLWTLLEVDEAEALRQPLRGFSVLGRLRDDVDEATADRQVQAIAARLAADSPTTNEGWTAEMHPVRWWILDDIERPLWVAFAVSLLVLLTACGTATNLMLAEVAARRRSAAVRRALGARTWWLARSFLVESLVLATAGGALGLLFAHFALGVASALLADHLPRASDVGVDLRTLGAACLAVLVAAVVSGFAPAFTLARTSVEALRGRGSEDRGGRRLRRLLVAAEAALAVVAVVGAALCLQTVNHLQHIRPGFEPQGLLTARLELPEGDEGSRQPMMEELLTRLEALPGVVRAGASGFGLPLVDNDGNFELYVEDRDKAARPDVVVDARAVSAGFREAMAIPLVAGRFFDPGEGWETANAVVINETMARRYWPHRDPIGRWVEWQTGDRGTVVGVVGDVRSASLTREVKPEVYIAWGRPKRSQALVIRGLGSDPLSLVDSVRATVAATIPGTAIHGVATGEELVRDSYGDRRVWSWLLSVFAVLVVILGAVGLYGVVAHWVAGREREIGVRMALGALPAAVVRKVLAQGMGPVAAGVGLGIVAALVLVRHLESQLYGVASRDPITLVGAAFAVAFSAVLICALPARRAARVDPSVAVRDER